MIVIMMGVDVSNINQECNEGCERAEMCNSWSVHVCIKSKKPADTIEAKVAEEKAAA